MSDFQDETIESKLRDKIYDSGITVVFISKGMDDGSPQQDQWIPWEISYSLREKTRNGRTSHMNGVLAVVLPDILGSYDYFILDDSCQKCHCRTLKTSFLFQILSDNMFNVKKPELIDCDNHWGARVYRGYSSYIHSVKWADVRQDVGEYLNIAEDIKSRSDEYDIVKTVE